MDKIDLVKNIIWPTCIFTTQWPKHSTYAVNLQKNIDDWAETNTESRIARKVKKNLYESTFDYLDQDVECVRELEKFFMYSVFEVCKDLNQETWIKNNAYGVEITESWFHVTKNNGYHDVHSHPMNSWSGIYYLNIGESTAATLSGVNRFYAPFKTDYIDRGNEYLTNIWDVEPKNGMLVLFPSYLQHSAMAYLGKTPRYVIAFNARVQDAR
jgi:uncharacterized protein (TIGR02466 family)